MINCPICKQKLVLEDDIRWCNRCGLNENALTLVENNDKLKGQLNAIDNIFKK